MYHSLGSAKLTIFVSSIKSQPRCLACDVGDTRTLQTVTLGKNVMVRYMEISFIIIQFPHVGSIH